MSAFILCLFCPVKLVALKRGNPHPSSQTSAHEIQISELTDSERAQATEPNAAR
jgi:hypothetical protein